MESGLSRKGVTRDRGIMCQKMFGKSVGGAMREDLGSYQINGSYD